MGITSTTALVLAALGGFLLALCVLLPTLARARQQARMRAAQLGVAEQVLALQRDDLKRLALAQHWARGGLLSKPDEAWRPMLTALSLSAVSCQGLEQLDTTLRELVGDVAAAADAQLANIVRQARGEFEQTRAERGEVVEGAQLWPWPALAVRTAEMLVSARVAAEQLIRARSYPPPPGT